MENKDGTGQRRRRVNKLEVHSDGRQHTYNTKKYKYRKRQIQIQMKYTQLKEVRESTH